MEVSIVDTNAERLSTTYDTRIEELNPRLICFVVYGQNVNAGTTNMSGAVRLSNFLKTKNKNILLDM